MDKAAPPRYNGRSAAGRPPSPLLQKEPAMRKILSASLALLIASGGFGRADSPDQARAVIEQAIKAHGGADALARTRLVIQQHKGEIATFGATVPFTGEWALHLPDQGRWSFDLDAGGTKIRTIFVLNRDKGWRLGGGATKELSKQ